MIKLNKLRNRAITATVKVLEKAKADPKSANRRLLIALKGRDLGTSQKKVIIDFVNELEGADNA